MEQQKPKKKQLRRLFVFLADLTNWLLLLSLWIYTWMNYYATDIARPFGYKGNWLVFALYGVVLFLLTYMYGGYKVGHHRQSDLFFSGALALCFTNLITYIQTSLLGAAVAPIRPLAFSTLIGFGIIWLWALVTQRLYRKFYPPHRLLMIYDGRSSAQALIQKITRREDKYHVCETIDISQGMDYIEERMTNYTSVIFSDLSSLERNALLKHAYRIRVRVYMTPKLSDILIRSAREIELFDSPLLLSQNQDLSMEQRVGKRIMDLGISVVGILITSPIMLLIAAAIKLSDGGKVLYTQERLTKGGKIFRMYKFRSMVVDADKIDGNRLATQGDPRITKVGRIIRKIRVDELPQLFNILKGEMSFVGPRPEHPEIAALYEQSIPEFSFRLNVKAGLTGYAQVIGKYNTTPYDKIKMDLMYITGYSLLLDIKIILMTFKIFFNFESTEGIADNEKIAPLYDDKPKTQKSKK